MTLDLDEIKNQIEGGQIEAARENLKELAGEDPLNAAAWELLAGISDDPNERLECYRHILQIDPGNREIAVKLLEITAAAQTPPSQPEPLQGDDPILYCAQCGGPAEVRFVGDLKDKRAICSYCGTEVDIPDSYRRIQKLRDHQHLPGGGERIIESTTIETRQDGIPDPENINNYPLELQKIIEIVKEKGASALIEEHLKDLQENGVKLPHDVEELDPEDLQDLQELGEEGIEIPPRSLISKTLVETTQEESGLKLKFPFFGWIKKRTRRPLSVEEIILLSGDQLPPEERANCPNPVCGAVVSKTAKECPWCGGAL
jgi:hypothetical protein